MFTNVCITCNLPYGRHTTNTDPWTHCITYPATEECFTIYKGTTVRKYFLYTNALLTHIWEGLTTRDRSNVIIFVLPWGRNRKSHGCQESSNLPLRFLQETVYTHCEITLLSDYVYTQHVSALMLRVVIHICITTLSMRAETCCVYTQSLNKVTSQCV